MTFIALQINAQSWKAIEESSIQLSVGDQRSLVPDTYNTYSLDMNNIKRVLLEAPKEFASNRSQSDIEISIPMPDGTLQSFMIYESATMRPGIQARYPSIRSYKGYAVGNGNEKIRFTISPLGFHGAIKTAKGQIYIDPYSDNNKEHYMSYFTKDDHSYSDIKKLGCGHDIVNDQDNQIWESVAESAAQGVSMRTPSEQVIMREYDFALGCTGEWGATQTDVTSILAKFNIAVSRLNIIFENELSLRIILIDETDQLIYQDPNTDPYSDRQGFVILPENTAALNNVIGADAYDFGHVWSNCNDIGGVAFGSSACTANKGAGVTCIGASSNVAAVMVNITAHEIGHQLSAGHTWNRCTADIENQYAPASAFEPGSGTTIMSYAGACGSNNVSNTNTDVYHVGTIDQIRFFTTENVADACATKIVADNNIPEASIPLENGFTIPISTPFEMTGEAFDADGDAMTYTWEQYDLGPTTDLGNPVGTSPLFRNYDPSTSLTRVFPRLNDLISGSSNITEILPTISRDLTFRFVVRDNNPEIGGVDWETIKFKSTASAGPFKVNFPSIDENFVVGDSITVTWDVANTDSGPVNCDFVNIFLSTDRGLTYPYQLAKNAPNDGSHQVIVPNAPSNLVKIKVKAVDNIFFDISNLNSQIRIPSDTTYYIGMSELCLNSCLPEAQSMEIATAGFNTYADSISFEVVSGLPTGAVATFIPEKVAPGETSTIDINLDNVTGDGSYTVSIIGISSGDTIYRDFALETTGNDFASLEALTPLQNDLGVEGLPTFSWTDVIDADSYTLQLSKSPAFTDNLIDEKGLTVTSFPSSVLLSNSTTYYWRVIATNACGKDYITETRAFSTEALQCSDFAATDLPKNISQSGLPTIESQIFISGNGQISDVNITKFRGLHDNVRDLVVTLISPDELEVVVLNKRCNNSSNFNCGFDDDTPFTIQCPMTNGLSFIPEEPLSNLNGSTLQGLWTLRVEDTSAGSGGQLQEFEMEICSNVVLDNPYIVNNADLGLPPGSMNRVKIGNLLTEDANNIAPQLIYTVVSIPQNGILSINNANISVGDQFTQQDINQDRIAYRHDGSDTTTDQFTFTVIDGEGGFIGITPFKFVIDPSFTSSTEDVDNSDMLNIYPNPVDETLFLSFSENIGSYNVQIVDVAGKLVYTENNQVTQSKAINTKAIATGTYFVIVTGENESYQKQIVITH